ncbi:1-acyl-sn-glycerol-3-phosphate acyltransferase [candidate division KSB1 bacterium]|nr:1-acyl-sn-glycerol-3-phosphate acyltransferase [candidate division KSB1 bacterium]
MTSHHQSRTTSPHAYLPPIIRHAVDWYYHCLHPYIHVENEYQLNTLPEPVIFAANHNTSFETVILALYLLHRRDGKKVSFLVDWMYQYLPIVGWLMKHIDAIYGYNKPSTISFINRFRKSPETQKVTLVCIRYLRDRRNVVIFPEGTRNTHPYQLKRGRKGIGDIVLQTGVPVIPIGIDFPSRMMRGKIPRFGRIIFRFGSIMDFRTAIQSYCQKTAHEALCRHEQRKLYHQTISDITHKIMNEIAVLSGKCFSYATAQQSPQNELIKNTTEEKLIWYG